MPTPALCLTQLLLMGTVADEGQGSRAAGPDTADQSALAEGPRAEGPRAPEFISNGVPAGPPPSPTPPKITGEGLIVSGSILLAGGAVFTVAGP